MLIISWYYVQNLSRKFLYGTKSVNVQKRKISLMSGKTGPWGKQGVCNISFVKKNKRNHKIFQKHKLWSDYYRLSNGCQGITLSLELSWSNAKQTDIRNKVRQKTTSHRHLFITSLKLLTTCFINKKISMLAIPWCTVLPQPSSNYQFYSTVKVCLQSWW